MTDLKAVTINKVATTLDKNNDLIVKFNCSFNLSMSGNMRTLAELTAHQKSQVTMQIEPQQLGLDFGDNTGE